MLSVLMGLVYLGMALAGIYLILSLVDFGVTIYYIIRRRF
jgi:hypothetical protein|tara:strand:+ start:1627 stop:1746 length:120 start_codon:yes stop_codon:yes gene_type:complete